MSAEDAMLEALREELDIEFEAASTFVAMHVSESNFTDAIKLKLYGLFKQATVGPCDAPKPGMFDLKGKSKWSAWKELGSMAQEDAMVRYIETVASVQPEWKTMGGGRRGGESGGPMGPVISTLAGNASAEGAGGDAYAQESLLGAAARGDLAALDAALRSGAPVNEPDGGGCCALHWAADQGHVRAVERLVEHGADVNARDEMGCCPLHLAVAGGHVDVVRILASFAGTDLAAEDEDGLTPLGQAIDSGAQGCAEALLRAEGVTKDRLGGEARVREAIGMAEKKGSVAGVVDLLKALL